MNQARVDFPVTLVIAKEGELCWLGHLDFARAIERALRRGELPLTYTEGFHRRAKLRLPEPLPLGVGSEGERFVVPLSEPRGTEEVAARLAGGLPRGLRLVAVLPGAQPERRDAPLELEIDALDRDSLSAAIGALPAQLPAIGGAWELVAAPAAIDPLGPAAQGGRAKIRLVPTEGARASVGRFLELLKQAAPPGFATTRVHRRVAWHGEEPSLPSSPLAPGQSRADDPEAQEASPCTP